MFQSRIQHQASRLAAVVKRQFLLRSPAPNNQILDYYLTTAPSTQNALDIFKGEWASKFPGDLAALEAGPLPLFEDSRITWAIEQFGGVAGKTGLELGPLEAGHTYMLEQAGAASITAIEANTRAYLKCLIAKEILQLNRSSFLCGDFLEYLRSQPETLKFDFCIASGVLYHMTSPVELLARLAQVSDRIFLWTHYYDPEILARSPGLAARFPSSTEAEYAGFRHTLHRQEYATALNSMSFCGGNNRFSCWMRRDEILACLKHFGLQNIQINFDTPDHPNGPSFALVATR